MKPAIFNTEMVRAILDGRKTQTRRLVNNVPKSFNFQRCGVDRTSGSKTLGKFVAIFDDGNFSEFVASPYKISDIIYVRETFIRGIEYDENDHPLTTEDGSDWIWKTYYRADDEMLYWVDADGDPISPPWKPSIHMPKEYARIFLRVKDIRVERLNEISENDARAEGCSYGKGASGVDPAVGNDLFPNLWESIYGKGSFDNRYVWVTEFEVISKEEAING